MKHLLTALTASAAVALVLTGALFIGLVQKGMNLARIESYLQTVVLGALLILAVIVDQIRLRDVASLKA